MKHMKKFVSLALALMMALALCVPAMASNGPDDPNKDEANITINIEDPNGGTVGDETYTVYKIFTASVNGEKMDQTIENPNGTGSTFANVSYTIEETSPFYETVKNFKNGDNAVFKLEKVTTSEHTYVVTRNKVSEEANADDVYFDAANLATELKKVIDAPNADLSSVFVLKSEGGSFVVPNTGYYLIISSLGSKMIVDTIGQGDMNIKTKNSLPTLGKSIIVPKPTPENPEGTEKVDSTTASYGDTVKFALDVYVPETAVGGMVVHDFMDSNLIYVGITAAPTDKAKEHEVTRTLDLADDDTYFPANYEAEDFIHQDFIIPAEIVADHLGETVTIEYTATLKSGAPTATAIKNIANLTYSQYKTPDDDVEVWTYEFDLVKTDSSNVPLAGAKFEFSVDLVDEGNNVYRVAVAGDENTTRQFTTDSTGRVTIKGLANGTYTLTEVEAPAGYNKLTEPVTVTIKDENGNAMFDNEGNYTHTDESVQIVNKTGSELPSTGGIGTTIFYVVGGILVVGAAILLMTRKRISEDD